MTTSSSQEVGDATGGLGDNFYELSIQETFELYDELRSCPVRRSDSLGGFYWLTRYEDVRAAAQDWETFSSGRKGIMLPPIESTLRGQALEMDPPEHGPWRRLFLDALTPERLREITPDLVATANGLIDRFAGVGKCDLYNDFAAPLPALGVCQAIGVSAASVDRIRESSDKFTSQSGDDTTDDRVAAMQAIGAIVLEELHARRDDPRDDYLTRVVQSELYGRPMNDEELGLFMAGFLVAGHETTTSAMVSLFYHVLPRPDLVQRMLSDDGVLAAAIEEAVRLYSPFQSFHRTATTDVTVGDVTIPVDETVKLCFAAANRDPSAFERPDEFDPDRVKPNPHLGFGFGRHLCLGARLARLEMRLAFKELLRRLPDIHLTSADIEWDLVGGTLVRPVPCYAEFTPQPV